MIAKSCRNWGGFTGLLAAMALGAAVAPAQDSAKSLDPQWSQDLDEDLFSELMRLEEPQPPLDGGVDPERKRERGGEDVGLRHGAHPLGQVVDTMQRVRDRLRTRDLDEGTQQMQLRIVQNFDELIERLKKQQPPRLGKTGRSQPRDASSIGPGAPERPPSAQPRGTPLPVPATDPADDSTIRLGHAESAESTAQARDRLMQEAWGNLPTAARQQMQSARPERFLPKYARLIEDYFQRLADENQD